MSVAVLPASAISYTGLSENMSGSVAKYWGLCFDYWAGHITYEEFTDKSQILLYDVDDVTDKKGLERLISGLNKALEGVTYAATNTSAGVCSVIREILGEFGIEYNLPLFELFDDLWDKFCNKNGYTTSDVDMKGYGALCITVDKFDHTIHEYYGDYGIIFYDHRGASVYGDSIYHYWVRYGNFDDVSEEYASGSAYCYNGADRYEVKFFGHWTYEDETSADDLITDPGESSLSPDDLPEDTDLTDFLKDLLEKLMNAFPDTSTIEGLLRSILAKLGTLDSDNDNELLTQILVAIQALENNGQTADNSELVKALNDLKKALLIGDGAETVTLGYLLKQLVDNQIKLSDITIDYSLYNNRFKVIQARLLTKFSFFLEINDFVNYAVDCYKDTSENPTIDLTFDNLSIMKKQTIDFSFFNEYIDTIRFIVAAFVYLTFAFKTFRKIPGYINGGDNT